MKSTKGLSFIVFDNSLAKFEPIQMTRQSHLWFFLRKGHDHIFTICNLDACINVMKSSFGWALSTLECLDLVVGPTTQTLINIWSTTLEKVAGKAQTLRVHSNVQSQTSSWPPISLVLQEFYISRFLDF